MAGNLAELNNYLNNVLAIQDQSVRDGLNEQGLSSFDDFEGLTEKDIAQICSNVRKPGGVIPNPNAAVLGQPGTVTNPGVLVGHAVEVRLKMLCYFIKHLLRIQRLPFTAAVGTLARLTAVYKLKELDDEDLDVTLPTPLTKLDDVRVTLENIDEYLRLKLGYSGCPLAYVTRDSIQLPADDPGFGLPNYVDEMITRAPHTGIPYQRDLVSVWNVIRHVAHGGPAWNWVSSFVRSRDGRAAYLALKTHYLGDSFISRIRAMADNRLDTAFYDGKARNFTFEHYCALLNNAFADLESTGEIVTESRKLRVFTTGLKDPRLETAKSQIQATPALQVSFEAAVTFVSTFLESQRSHTNVTRGREISNVASGRGGRGSSYAGTGRGRGRASTFGRGRSGRTSNSGRGSYAGRSSTNMSDRYYTPEEWEKLTIDQRQAVRDKRSERDRRRGVEVVTRSVRPRNSDSNTTTDTSANTNVSSITPTSGIGGVMSRRSQLNSNGANVSFSS